jgi:hypothetical protein
MRYPFATPDGDEKPLNRQFSRFLAYSLQFGPDLLNRVHAETPLQFSEKAHLVAHQDSSLPQYPTTDPTEKSTG